MNSLINENEVLSDTKKTIYGVLVGGYSGIVIFVFQELYNIICGIVTEWENHMFESDKENSYLIKTFIFNFFVSYLLLFYYAFADADITDGDISKKFSTLGVNFVSMVFTKNLTVIIKLNILPFVLFFFKKRRFYKIWPTYRRKLKAQYVN